VIVWTWSAPFVFALSEPLPLGWPCVLATALWIVGFVFQAGGRLAVGPLQARSGEQG
jgi:hypothetical protein